MSTFARVMLGWQAVGRGIHFLIRHPRLWGWALLPLAIQLVVFSVLITLLVEHFDTLFGWLTHYFSATPAASDATWWQVAIGWLAQLASGVARLLAWVLATLILFFCSYLVGAIIAGPFNDLLSERTEALAGGTMPDLPACTWWQTGLRSVRAEIVKALFFLLAPLALLLLHLIPVIGNLLYIPIVGLFEMWATGFACVDYPMARRNWSARQRLAFARSHAASLASFGVIFWIPGALILCAPALVVGGTLLYMALESPRDEGRPLGTSGAG